MPRWLFLIAAAAVALAVFGSALIVLRGRPAPAPLAAVPFSEPV